MTTESTNNTMLPLAIEAIRALQGKCANEVIVTPQPGGGVSVRIIETQEPLYVALEDLSKRLPGNPSVTRLKRICRDNRIKIIQIGKTPAVSINQFREGVERYA